MKVSAFAALGPREALKPFSYRVPSLKPFELLVQVSHCGLCHSDIHLIDDDWNRSKYPLVAGHEIVGTVVQKGTAADGVQIGQRIGVSWIRNSCLVCPDCAKEETTVCLQRTTTCNGNHGGFANYMVADSRFVFAIPEALDSAHAAPLLCAGATVYPPLKRYHPQSVAVIGIGGLGHLALQFASAFGCHVTAISGSPAKESEAKAFGANQFCALSTCLPNSFDLILSTVHADLDWNWVLKLLKPKGTLCFLGRPPNPAPIEMGHLISSQKTICGSSTANRPTMNEMLAFAAKNNIKPMIERMPLSQINQAIERVKANAARYRIVLEI